jgi:hypothetical protein
MVNNGLGVMVGLQHMLYVFECFQAVYEFYLYDT